MFHKSRKKPILYKAFAEKKRLEQTAAASAPPKPYNVQDDTRKVRYRGKAEICVMSLFQGCGTTYLSEILAVFLSEYRKEKTCLVETKGLSDTLSSKLMDVVTCPCDLSPVYKGDYHFIVRDMGTFQSISVEEFKEMERADFKCIVSWPDEHSLSALASFVEKTEHADSFIYCFNMVPKDRVAEIFELMEDFSTIILPCTSLDSLDGNLVKKLFSVFGKG